MNILDRVRRKVFSVQEKKAVVLCYHRIANPSTDPWSMAVSPDHFKEHAQHLKKNYRVISTKELRERVKANELEAKTICITFDDGYIDNFEFAKPVLDYFELPATFFIPSLFVEKRKAFWWEVLEHICLRKEFLPETINLELENTNHRFVIDNSGQLNEVDKVKHCVWKGKTSAPTLRAEMYLKLFELLRPKRLFEIEKVIDQLILFCNFKVSELDQLSYPMSSDQIKELAQNKLFTISLHTESHPLLASHSYKTQLEEIQSNKLYLENLLSENIDQLAFPYGQYNNDTMQVVKDLGLKMVFTTQKKPVKAKDVDATSCGRFYVKNITGDKFEQNLKDWFNR